MAKCPNCESEQEEKDIDYLGDSEFQCPHCDNEKMEYRSNGKTHIWVCPECPNIMFEYYSDKNIKDLYKLIK